MDLRDQRSQGFAVSLCSVETLNVDALRKDGTLRDERET